MYAEHALRAALREVREARARGTRACARARCRRVPRARAHTQCPPLATHGRLHALWRFRVTSTAADVATAADAGAAPGTLFVRVELAGVWVRPDDATADAALRYVPSAAEFAGMSEDARRRAAAEGVLGTTAGSPEVARAPTAALVAEALTRLVEA